MSNRLHIGIVTWHYYGNFGSALQSLALFRAASSMGEVEFVNYRDPRFGSPNKLKDAIRIVLGATIGHLISKYAYGKCVFSHRYLKEGKLTTDEKTLTNLAGKYDIIICGSDQIWAPNCFNPVYFASFAQPHTRKISYAASIGLNDIPSPLVQEYRTLLSSFAAISVREDEGKKLLYDRCGINSTVVLDPTLLHDASFYSKLQCRVPGIKGRFMLCYFLNTDHQYQERVECYARQHNLQIVGVSDRDDDGNWMLRLTNLGAHHFLWLVNNAEVVMTDSYHGTIFSLLFHKTFYTFVRFAEDSPICQNSRIRQLQSYFNLEGHILGATDIPMATTMDYINFERRLGVLRKESLDYLHRALVSC